MIHSCRLALLTAVLTLGFVPAWAQLPAPIPMTVGSNFSIDGLKLTVTACSVSGTNAAGGCANDELVATNGNRGGISFQLQNTAGTSSAALQDNVNRNNTNDLIMTYTISVAQNGSTKVVTGATETLVGQNNIASDCNNCSTAVAQGKSQFSVGATPNPLLDTLAVSTANPQTAPVSSNSLTSPSGAFTLTETLELNAGGNTITGLKIYAMNLHFTTAPEPASIAIMALGLAGLAAARKRRHAFQR